MRHFLDIESLRLQDVTTLLDRAFFFKKTGEYPLYSNARVANMFYENSTRTRVSFELAARQLSMLVVTLDPESSSEQKGENIEDTVNTLAAMGITHLVVRHSENFLPHKLTRNLNGLLHVVNAGDGTHAHPSQAMLDFMTILEQKSDLKKLKIVIIGDLRHSRVANSIQCLSQLLGVGKLIFVSPKVWQPQVIRYGTWTDSLKEGMENADVVIALRIQNERLSAKEHLDLATYRRDYAITNLQLRAANQGVMIMHPGPINRGVEIDSDVADGPQSFVLQQVRNGIYMRMAILEWCLQGLS